MPIESAHRVLLIRVLLIRLHGLVVCMHTRTAPSYRLYASVLDAHGSYIIVMKETIQTRLAGISLLRNFPSLLSLANVEINAVGRTVT